MSWLTALALCISSSALLADKAPQRSEPRDAKLRDELLQRMKVDQEVRTASESWCRKHGIRELADTEGLAPELRAEMEALSAKFEQVDHDNGAWLKELVTARGWPTRTLVGRDGAKAAWILVQHADADPKFQRICLDQMAKLPREEISPEDMAYLTDRVLLAEGKKQRYGTQFSWVEGKLQPRPLEDEAHVDRRRAEVGLSPLAEYLRDAESFYGDK